MKRLFSVVLCLCLCACLSSCSTEYKSHISDYDTGYYEGYESGHEDGFDDGFKEGYNEAELEYEDKYSEGYNDGYQDGATYTCLFFGDVDRALKSAYKGSSWGTFINAYDQYISNIYDDSETKSKLFWAFASIKSGDGLTTDERDLLISTFGEDLFIRNNIELKIK